MFATEFETTVLEDGKIEIPVEYRKHPKATGNGFGSLAHRANTKLWDKEADAWKNAAIEKYVSR